MSRNRDTSKVEIAHIGGGLALLANLNELVLKIQNGKLLDPDDLNIHIYEPKAGGVTRELKDFHPNSLYGLGSGDGYTISFRRPRLTLKTPYIGVKKRQLIGVKTEDLTFNQQIDLIHGDFATWVSDNKQELENAGYEYLEPTDQPSRQVFQLYLNERISEAFKFLSDRGIPFKLHPHKVEDIDYNERGETYTVTYDNGKTYVYPSVIWAAGMHWIDRFSEIKKQHGEDFILPIIDAYRDNYNGNPLANLINQKIRDRRNTDDPITVVIAGTMNSGIDAVVMINELRENRQIPSDVKIDIVMASSAGKTLEHHDSKLSKEYTPKYFTPEKLKEKISQLRKGGEQARRIKDATVELYKKEVEYAASKFDTEGKPKRSYPEWVVSSHFWITDLFDFWNIFETTEERALIKALKPNWDIRDTSLPPEIEHLFNQLKIAVDLHDRNDGISLTIVKGNIPTVADKFRKRDNHLEFKLVEKTGSGKDVGGKINADIIIDATGPGNPISNPALQTLKKKGYIADDGVGGIEVVNKEMQRTFHVCGAAYNGAKGLTWHYIPSIMSRVEEFMKVVLQGVGLYQEQQQSRTNGRGGKFG